MITEPTNPGPMRRDVTRRSGEAGQALALMAGAVTLMLVIAGLVVDGGVAFADRREGQNVADLAALAGTQVVAQHYTDGGRTGAQVYQAVSAIVAANGCTTSGTTPCSWTGRYVRPLSDSTMQPLGALTAGSSIPGGAQGVEISVVRQSATYFLKVIGLNSWDIGAQATAIAAQATGLPANGIMPFAIDPPNTGFEAGQEYQLTAGKDAPGNFSWLSWSGTNDAPSLAQSICNPNNPAMGFPAIVVGDPGKSNSDAVRACMQQLIDSTDVVLVPTWSVVTGGGNNTVYTLTGLAAFQLTSVGQPAIDTITARFVEYYALPSIGAGYSMPPCAPTVPTCEGETYFLGLVL